MAAKVALVTGANQGIGFGIVRRLCKEHPNWTVLGTSRSVEKGEEAKKKLQGEGLTASFVEADITNPDTIKALRDKLKTEYGGLDVLVNNAGIAFKVASTEAYSLKADLTMNTNIFGTHLLCDHIFPLLNDGARVVMMSSDMGRRTLNVIKGISTSRYESLLPAEPPMPVEGVLQAMKDFILSVEDGDYKEKGWPDDSAYGVSCIATTLLAAAYQQHFTNTVPDRDIVVNAADPGVVSTNMSSYKGPLTIDEGADTPYYVATLAPNTDVKGQMVYLRKIVKWS